MDCCGLPIAISTLACAIAKEVPDSNQLILLAAVFTQLGDTLNTIVAQRALCNQSKTTPIVEQLLR